MDCPIIEGLSFDSRSREDLAKIRKIQELSQALAISVSLGVFANIFAGNNTAESAYNIYSTDWQLFAQAMMAVPAIQRRAIYNEAAMQAFDHMNQRRQHLFWKAVANGCQIR